MGVFPAGVRASPWMHNLYGATLCSLFHRHRLLKCLKLCRALPGGRVLEVGCHDMLFYQLLNREFEEYTGIDPVPWAYPTEPEAVRLPNHVRVLRGHVEALALPTAAYDLVLCFESIEHVRDELQVAREMVRVLAPGGRLVLSMPIEFGPALALKVLARLLVRRKSEYTARELVEAAVRCRPSKIARDEHKGYDYRPTIETFRSLGLSAEYQRRMPFDFLPDWLNLGALVVFSKPLATTKCSRTEVSQLGYEHAI